jgi:O-antigen/teichoic acid export membrane protein
MELVRNSLLSLVLHISTRAANALIFILIGRSIDVTQAGVFQLATTYLLIFSVLTRGLDELVIRQVARFPRDVRRYFTTFLMLRLVLTIVLYGVLLIIVSFILNYPPNTSTSILVVSVGLVSDGLTSAANAILLGQRCFGIPTLVAVGVGALRLVLGGVLLSVDASLVHIATLWSLSSVIGAVVSIVLVGLQTRGLPNQCIFDRSLVSHELAAMVPFIVNGFLMAIEFQIDFILLSVLRNETEVGWYGAATTIVFTLAMIPQAYRIAVYPLMTHYADENHQKLIRLYELSVRYLGTLALPMTAGILLLAPSIINLVFKPDFLPAVPSLQNLAVVLIFMFLNVPNVRMMFVHNRQDWITWMLVGSMLINVGLNLWLTPILGAQGAALARVCSSSIFFLSNYLVLRFVAAKLDINLLRLLWRPVLATTLMSALVWSIRDMPVLIVILIGAVIYLGVLLLIGGIPMEDWRYICKSLQRHHQSVQA